MATRSVTVRLPVELLAVVDEKRDRRSMTEYVEQALTAAVKDREPELKAWDVALLLPRYERLREESLRVDRELRWLNEEPEEGMITRSEEKLIPFFPTRSRYLGRDPKRAREELAEELERIHAELNPPQNELAFIKKYGREPSPCELLFGAVEDRAEDEAEADPLPDLGK
jgi:hypothetical protein